MWPPQPAKSYSKSIKARFNETWRLNGHVRTADQVLASSDEIVSSLPAPIVHWYQFEFDSVLYEFSLGEEQSEGVNTQEDLGVLINPDDLTTCWVNGHILVVHPWEPPEDL